MLTASDLNAEYNNILNNALSLISPITGMLDLDGNELVLDGDADSSITASTDDRIDFRLNAVDLFRMDGTVTSPVNGLDFIARATGSPASIQAQGSDSNVGFDFRDDNGNELQILLPVASAVNEFTMLNAATGNPPILRATGESNIGFQFQDSNSNEVLIGASTASAINEVTITNAAIGNNPQVEATGGDTDISLNLVPKGTGVVQFGGGDLSVPEGGTGVSTLTDGSVLLGSGTAAITAMAVLADGEIIVGDGATDPVADSYQISHNLVTDGGMRVGQGGTSFATLTASQYTLDMWEWIDTGTTAAVVTITQDTDVPTVAEAGVKFSNSLKIDVTTAEDLAGADAALYLSHKIEARDCIVFGHGATDALAGRLSFWFKSTKTGIFTVNVDRDDASEKYSTEFTVATTNTWEKQSVTVPGDTNGTAISNDSGIGLALQFMMAVGGDGDTSTAGAWNASGATELATANQVNLLDNAANNILVTGVEFRLGSIDTQEEQQPFGQTLALVKRFFERISLSSSSGETVFSGYAISTTVVIVPVAFTEKIATPAISSSAGATFDISHENISANATGIAFSTIGLKSCRCDLTVSGAPFTIGFGGIMVRDGTDTTFIDIDSRL